LAVDLDQVERADRRDVTATVVADELENSQALAVADDGLCTQLPVDDEFLARAIDDGLAA
jgi:hypothetical protein